MVGEEKSDQMRIHLPNIVSCYTMIPCLSNVTDIVLFVYYIILSILRINQTIDS